MSAALVVRFSSLGDVLLAAHVPSFLRRIDPRSRVLFLTKERYADALRGHPDVDRFYMLEDRASDPAAPSPPGVRGGLSDLIAALRRENIGLVLDLHQNLRSSRVAGAFPEAKRALPAKHGLQRRLMVHARWLKPSPLPPLLATYRECCGLPSDAPLTPWLRQALSTRELERARDHLGGVDRFVLLGVGARWETKRWPARSFVELGSAIERELKLGARYAVAPGERVIAELRDALPHAAWGAIVELPVRPLAAAAAHAAAIVSNDSALLHLGPALGVPAVGIFGNTVPGFGFAFQGPHDEAVGIDLKCRPCDVHGKRRCPLGHHACMARLEPARVLEALRRALGAPETEAATL